MNLSDLELYNLSRELSREAWNVYEGMDWKDKKVIGDQFITSIDSVGANISEGFGRYHYLDKNKFNYNSRGSLLESIYWLELLRERGKIKERSYSSIREKAEIIHKKLNNYISSTKRQVNKQGA